MSLLPRLINKTLSVRLSLVIVSVMSILLMTSLIVVLIFSRRAIKEEAQQKASQTLEAMAQRIDNVLLSVEQAAGNIYYSIQYNPDNPDKMISYSRRLVEKIPYVIGSSIAFYPYHFKDRQYYMVRTEKRFVPGTKSDSLSIRPTTVSTDGSYIQQEWYTNPMTTLTPQWRTPTKEGRTDNKPVVTFCLPFPDKDGKPAAIISIDVSLRALSQIVLAYKPSPNSYCTLLSADGSYIVHPDSTKLMSKTVFSTSETEKDSTIMSAAKSMLSGETDYKPFHMNGNDYYVFYKPFKRAKVPGRAMEKLGWSAGIIYPENDIFGDYNQLIYYVLAIAVVGLLLLYILCRTILHHQLKPLIMLTQSAQHIAKGNYNDPIPDSRQKDEIGCLQNHFQQMQQSLSAATGQLEQMTTALQERGETLQAAYERAQQANQMKTVFLHNMTDHMVAPADSIETDVNTICDTKSPISREESNRLTDDILQQGNTITELLNNLLNASENDMKKGGHQ